MKFSVNIRWGWVWPVPTGQKRSPPTLVTYSNKAETLIQQFIHIVYHLRSTFLPCLGTLVYRIDVQYGINVQVGKFLKNIKRAGQNRRSGGKLFGKSINVQGEKLLENQ